VGSFGRGEETLTGHVGTGREFEGLHIENTCDHDAQCKLAFVKCSLFAKTTTSDEIFNLQRPKSEDKHQGFLIIERHVELIDDRYWEY